MTELRKAIFLEYKFGDYDTEVLYNSGANEAVAWMERLNKSRLKQLLDWGVKIQLSFGGFEDTFCPLDPKSWQRLQKLTKQAVSFSPQGIIIDHFRFSGHWEESFFSHTHTDCSYCQGKNRGEELTKIANRVIKIIPPKIETGYYALPGKFEEIPFFGQNHELLGETFNYISPMLYHRMLDKPVEYIHQFTQYLASLTDKPIVPAIAVKDMPDDLPDQIDKSVLHQEYEYAIRPPSTGVCWFSWDGAVEKQKTQIIAKIWK